MIRVVALLLFGWASSAQQTASITGIVTSEGNMPEANVNVSLKGTKIGSVTDAKGYYEIRNIQPGTYVLRITSIGYATRERNISLKAGEQLVENITLSASAEDLSEVVVEGIKKNPFGRRESSVVSKMPLKDIENPQVYNTITAELLREQAVTNFDDALKNAPGLDKLWESTGRGGDGAGYFSLRGFAVQPTMINGLPALTAGSPDLANVERIEVIKGPSGTLFGSSLISYGGLINLTSKKPYEYFGGAISYMGGTFGLNRVTADINSPIGESNKAFLRVNSSYQREASFQDAGFRRSFFIAPTLTYKVNDRLTFGVNTEFYNGRNTNQTMLFLDRFSALRATNIDELGYDRNRSYTSNDLYIDTPTYNLQGQMTYKLSDKWTSQTAISRSSAQSKGYYSYLYEGTGSIEAATGLTLDGIILARYTSKQDHEIMGTDIQQNFIGEFNIGKFKNKFIGGLDYLNLNQISNSTGYGAHGFVNLGVDEAVFQSIVPALHTVSGGIPVGGATGDSGVLTQNGADAGIALLGNPSAQPYKTKQEVYSAYASNIFYLMPNLSAMASIRFDRFNNEGNVSTSADDYNQTAWSPKFGLVYQPIQDKLSLFANYMNGFSNVGPSTDIIDGVSVPRTFNPEHAEQYEFGAKMSFLNDRITGSVSYYNIDVKDMVYTQYVDNGTAFPDQINVQNGRQRSKGVEFALTANPVDGLNILAGYSYNDSNLIEGDPDFVGHRPESAGPQNLANLWVSYRFNRGAAKGFGLAFGGNYASENKIMNRNVAGTFRLPEYTVLSASAFYDIDAFRFMAKIDNLTQEEYYKGWSTISPQRPRVFTAGMTYNF